MKEIIVFSVLSFLFFNSKGQNINLVADSSFEGFSNWHTHIPCDPVNHVTFNNNSNIWKSFWRISPDPILYEARKELCTFDLPPHSGSSYIGLLVCGIGRTSEGLFGNLVMRSETVYSKLLEKCKRDSMYTLSFWYMASRKKTDAQQSDRKVSNGTRGYLCHSADISRNGVIINKCQEIVLDTFLIGMNEEWSHFDIDFISKDTFDTFIFGNYNCRDVEFYESDETSRAVVRNNSITSYYYYDDISLTLKQRPDTTTTVDDKFDEYTNKKNIAVIDSLTIYFEADSPGLDSLSKAELSQFIGSMSCKSINSITVNGYADKSGRDKYNYNLSVERTNNVSSYIVSLLECNHIKMKKNAYGESKAIAKGKFDRRVEVILWR